MYCFICFVDADTSYCWVYLSSDRAFEVYYKMRQVLLQIATACLLQSASGITMCDNFIIKRSATKHGSQRCCNINCILNICRQYYSSESTLWKTFVATSQPASKFWVVQVWHCIFHALSVMTILLATGSSFQTTAWPCVFLYDRGSGVSRNINVCPAVPFKGKSPGDEVSCNLWYSHSWGFERDLLLYALYTIFLLSVI